jgi:hypothetical protein
LSHAFVELLLKKEKAPLMPPFGLLAGLLASPDTLKLSIEPVWETDFVIPIDLGLVEDD